MDVEAREAAIAAAIGEAARARMLYCLMDGHARTSTELAVVGEVSPPTASVHLERLRVARLVEVERQGRHRYYRLADARVASVLEALSVLAGEPRKKFVPRTPDRLRAARTCYDHLAGTLGVALHDGLMRMGWLRESGAAYELTQKGSEGLAGLGSDVLEIRAQRRRFAFPCLDWSERRPHLGGALGAAFLRIARERRWVRADLDSRALSITRTGAREMETRFGIRA